MKTAFRTISLLLLCSMLSSCIFLITGSVKRKAKKNLTVENGSIPSDFGRYNATMLIAKVSDENYQGRQFNRQLEKKFTEYEGEYIIEKRSEIINSDKYSDTKKYRWFFDTEFESTSTYMNSEGGLSQGVLTHFSIEDRHTGEVYKADYTHSMYTKLMKAYIENLNEEIKANR